MLYRDLGHAGAFHRFKMMISWKRPFGPEPLGTRISRGFSRYAREITIVLIVKAIGLVLLWAIFFSRPAPPLGQNPTEVRSQILGPGLGSASMQAPK